MGLGLPGYSNCKAHKPSWLERTEKALGLYLFGSRCSCGPVASAYREVDKNPDPSRFVITQEFETDNYIAMMVHYPNCTNYEGKKIMVFRKISYSKGNLAKLDPHFCDRSHNNPGKLLARFVPTNEGWILARALVTTLEDEE